MMNSGALVFEAGYAATTLSNSNRDGCGGWYGEKYQDSGSRSTLLLRSREEKIGSDSSSVWR